MLKLWSRVLSNGSKKRFLVYFPAASVGLPCLTHRETEAQRKKKLSQGHSTQDSCKPRPGLACVLPTLPSIICGSRDSGQRLGDRGWGAGAGLPLVVSQEAAQTTHPVVLPLQPPSPRQLRGEGCGFSVSQWTFQKPTRPEEFPPSGAGKGGVAGAGL